MIRMYNQLDRHFNEATEYANYLVESGQIEMKIDLKMTTTINILLKLIKGDAIVQREIYINIDIARNGIVIDKDSFMDIVIDRIFNLYHDEMKRYTDRWGGSNIFYIGLFKLEHTGISLPDKIHITPSGSQTMFHVIQ